LLAILAELGIIAAVGHIIVTWRVLVRSVRRLAEVFPQL
jgi:hypothetical protein